MGIDQINLIKGMENLPEMFIRSKDWAKLIPFGKDFKIEYVNGFLKSIVIPKVNKKLPAYKQKKQYLHSIIEPIFTNNIYINDISN